MALPCSLPTLEKTEAKKVVRERTEEENLHLNVLKQRRKKACINQCPEMRPH